MPIRRLILGALMGLFLLFQAARADTTFVAGQVSGTWNMAGSPYLVLADSEVPYGLSLIIEPGVQVKFAGHFKFIAHGTLTAIGTPDDSILFSHHIPDTSYTWAGIFFDGTEDTSELAYCILEWGYASGIYTEPTSRGGAAHITNTTVRIHNCRISNNKASSRGAGLYLNTSSSEIYTNSITHNICNGDGGGIYIQYSFSPNIHDNALEFNRAGSGAGIYIYNSFGAIFNNSIRYNSANLSIGGGLKMYLASPLIQNNRINHNSGASTFGQGITCVELSSPIIVGNEISWNSSIGIYSNGSSTPQVSNNTIFGNGSFAIQAYIPTGMNNIIAGNVQGMDGTITMTYSNIQGGWAGIGNFDLQPYFVNPYAGDFNLMPNSPCIDAGSPISPLDPDGTIADQGAHYFDQNQPQGTCSITLTPLGSTVLPPSGGTIPYGVAVQNSPDYYNIFDGWINLTQPDGQIIPMILRTNIYLAAGGSLTRMISLTLSASAMPGTYTVTGYVGENPSVIEDFDSFTFLKQTSDGYPGQGGTVTVSGWDVTETIPLKSSLPQSTQLLGHYPEPFNPTAAISYQLSANSHVRLQVFDTAGRLVETLVNGWRSAGTHELTFDASGLPSGVYLAKLEAGEYVGITKMILLK